ncbi:MAG: general secretion pathway protein GspK [Gammaproteobacteria bacterium]|nr:general secretion pathway protein GspK [Gammaproteobacteria bacterium]
MNYFIKNTPNHSQGSVLIIVMWLIMLALILVTAIATNVRLSALTVINQQQALQDWSRILETLDKAYLEILIEKLNKTNVKKITGYKEEDNDNLFDGRALQLHYKTPEGITVRIYNLSGKISLNRLSKAKLKQLLEQILGEHNKKIPELVDTWLDWQDKDDLKRLNGAEKQYYEKQKLPYKPRNSFFASVDEIRMIKGYEEIFKGIDLEKVFTLHGKTQGKVNPNYATKEVLLMIPGLDEKIVNQILKVRKAQSFNTLSELDILLPPSIMQKTKTWFTLKTSKFYAIAVYPTEFEQQGQTTVTAYVEEVNLKNSRELPIILRVLPSLEISIN